MLRVMGVWLAVMMSIYAGSNVEWGYSGKHSPDFWGQIKGAERCDSGQNQSPIDLDGMINSRLLPLKMDYPLRSESVVFNGHAIQLDFPEATDNRLNVEGISFYLKQVHFHSPSEHTLRGRSFPLEAHYVHADADGQLAVVSVLYEEGSDSVGVQPLLDAASTQIGDRKPLALDVYRTGLLPNSMDYYRYNGSLTTPPCSEGVRWFVMKETLGLSGEQIKRYQNLMGGATNRPVQPIHSRVILE